MSQSDILNYRLPNRMRELYTFIAFGPALESANDIHLSISGLTYKISNKRFLSEPIADSSVLMARALLHFVGIGLDGNTGALKNVLPRGDDISMSDVSLLPVEVADARKGWNISEQRAEDLMALCISTGNKVSAHLTSETANSRGASISELCTAFELVINLVNREVYLAKGLQAVSFGTGSSHGDITLINKNNDDGNGQ